MKNKRTSAEIKDFSGGLVTKTPLVNTNLKYSPSCLNVYSEGVTLRRRNGISKLNSSAVAGSPNGNGIINWILNASQQYIMGLFGSSLNQMSVSGNVWSGTFNPVSSDATNGTNLSDAIFNSVTYSGNLIMTTENRNKPQVLTTLATSYVNIDFGGTGTSPQCKYLQVWKEHLWMLNLGGGGSLTEDCNDITTWTDNDVGTGASTQTTFNNNETFRFRAGTASGDNANRTRDIGTIDDDYQVEVRTYFDTLGTISNGDYSEINFYNGVVDFNVRFSDDGLEVFDGSAWNEVGVDIVSEDVWNVWKFIVTAGTATAATLDIIKDGSYVGLQYDITNANAGNDGKIDIFARAGGSINRADWYLDYMYINSITAKIEYITNGEFNTFTGNTANNWNAGPTRPDIHFKLNDNAGNNTIADNGVIGVNGSVFSSATTVDTSTLTTAGKINTSIHFTSSSSHSIMIPTTSVTSLSTDTVGSLCMWVYPDSIPTVDPAVLFSISNNSEVTDALFYQNTTGNIELLIRKSGVTQLNLKSTMTLTTGAWNHIAIVQNGINGNFFVNSSLDTTISINTFNASVWFANLTSLNVSRVGCSIDASNTRNGFYNGRIDDFRYYPRNISISEVKSIYAEGNGTESFITTVQEGTIVKTGNKSYKLSDPGSYMVLSQTLTSSANLAGNPCVVGAWIFAENSDNYKIIVDDRTSETISSVLVGNGTWQYTTLPFTPTSNVSSIDVRIILVSGGTLYVDHVNVVTRNTSGGTDLSDRLQRTAIGTYNNFSGTDSGYNDILTPDDIGLYGSGILNDKMYVFKRWSIHRITYTGSTPLLDIKKAKSTVGTASQRSIKNIDIIGKGEVLIFLGTDRRIYIFDGYDATPVSDKISVTNGISVVYMNNINTQALDKVHAVVHSALSWYEIFIPIDDSTVPNYSIILDFSQGIENIAFWPNDNRNLLSSAVSDNAMGERVVYVQGNNNGLIYLTNSTNTDNGTAINSYWESFKLGSPVLLGKIDEIEVQTDNVACSPTFSWRMDWESPYISKTLSSSSYSHNYDPGRIDNMTQFKISDNSVNNTFKLWSIGLYERILGGGK